MVDLIYSIDDEVGNAVLHIKANYATIRYNKEWSVGFRRPFEFVTVLDSQAKKAH